MIWQFLNHTPYQHEISYQPECQIIVALFQFLIIIQGMLTVYCHMLCTICNINNYRVKDEVSIDLNSLQPPVLVSADLRRRFLCCISSFYVGYCSCALCQNTACSSTLLSAPRERCLYDCYLAWVTSFIEWRAKARMILCACT